MKLLIAFLALAVSAHGEVLKQTGVPTNINGANTACWSVDSPTFVVDCLNNRVGIGTASPDAVLSVIGVSSITVTANTPNLTLGTNQNGITKGNINFVNTGFGGNWGFGYVNNGLDIGVRDMATAGTPRIFTWKQGGNVGIGTDNPGTKLHMSSGTATFDGVTSSVTIGSGVSLGKLTIYQNGYTKTDGIAVMDAGSNTGIRLYNSGATLGRIDTGGTAADDLAINSGGAGRVGIGVAPTLGRLHIDVGTGVGQVTLDGSTGGCIMLRDTDDAGWTECDALDGTLSCSVDADGVCD